MSKIRLNQLAACLTATILATSAIGTPLPISPLGNSEEIRIIPNGVVPEAGWARARLNSGNNLTSVKYTYPDTTKKVRLYLIDTAIKNPGGAFSGNTKLTLLDDSPADSVPPSANPNTPSILVRGSNDPTTSSVFDHGTKVLSLIAGPSHGVALGTPIEVLSYDIYPQGAGSSTVGLLTDAIDQARLDHQVRADGTPAVICIAGGSAVTASNSGLQDAVNDAVAQNITVVVSAGNSGAPAANYIPAAYGTTSGVICVGASNYSNATLATSNTGSAVDLFAPGDNLACLDDLGTASSLTGTSGATAFVAATALATLSACPDLNPAQVEQELRKRAYLQPDGRRLLQMPLLDSDGDGFADILETFFGTDPSGAQDCPTTPGITCLQSATTLHFAVNAGLFVHSTPYVLADGTTWTVEKSINLVDWEPANGTLTVGEMSNSRYPITYSCPTQNPNCYLRIKVISGS